MTALYGPHKFRNLLELVLFHNRGFPVGGDRYTSYHEGQEIYTVLLPDHHGMLVPFGKAPWRIVDDLRLFLLNANMNVDDENLVIYSKRAYNCFGWFDDEDVENVANDLKNQVSGNPYLKGLKHLTQEMHPFETYPLLTIPGFLHHNLGLLNVSAHLIIYNTANDGALHEVWYEFEGRQATFSAVVSSPDTDEPLDILLEISVEGETGLPNLGMGAKLEGIVRHLALRADGTFNPKACTVFTFHVPTDFTLTSNKLEFNFERVAVDDLIERLLSRQFTPDASMAFTYFLCKRGVIVGEQMEGVEAVCNQSLHIYYDWGFRAYGGEIRIADRMDIYNLINISERESTADTMDTDGMFN